MKIITQYRSPLDMLYTWETKAPGKIYMYQPVEGKVKTYTWNETAMEVRRMAAYLKGLRFPPQSKIAILSKNCSHWIMADLAIMMAGHVSVPLYPNLTATSMEYILRHSESVLLFAGKLDDWTQMKPGVPMGLKCISFPDFPHEDCEAWQDIVTDLLPLREQVVRGAEEVGTILYTSGTTGTPKGVVHCFKSFSFTTQNAMPHLGFNTGSRFFSYLPLSHSAERSLVEMGSLYCGGTIYFAESVKEFAKNLADARPTEFLAVHHIWKKFQQRIMEKLPQKKLDMLLKIPVVSGYVKGKIKRQLGLQDTNNILAGASPTPVDLMEWFARLGIHIQEAYGLTENWSYSHINQKGRIKPGFVGQPFPGVETKISGQGEILIRHPGLMKEYYKEPEKTAVALDQEGFLHTEDAGYVDDEGYLKITGRIKDIFKTSKGNYVAPAPIEAKMAGDENIDFVCVVGNQLPQPLALVVPSAAANLKPDCILHEALDQLLSDINAGLDPVEKVSRIIIIRDEWNVDGGLLTPTFKVKRNEIERKYAPLYAQWLKQDEKVIDAAKGG